MSRAITRYSGVQSPIVEFESGGSFPIVEYGTVSAQKLVFKGESSSTDATLEVAPDGSFIITIGESTFRMTSQGRVLSTAYIFNSFSTENAPLIQELFANSSAFSAITQVSPLYTVGTVPAPSAGKLALTAGVIYMHSSKIGLADHLRISLIVTATTFSDFFIRFFNSALEPDTIFTFTKNSTNPSKVTIQTSNESGVLFNPFINGTATSAEITIDFARTGVLSMVQVSLGDDRICLLDGTFEEGHNYYIGLGHVGSTTLNVSRLVAIGAIVNSEANITGNLATATIENTTFATPSVTGTPTLTGTNVLFNAVESVEYNGIIEIYEPDTPITTFRAKTALAIDFSSAVSSPLITLSGSGSTAFISVQLYHTNAAYNKIDTYDGTTTKTQLVSTTSPSVILYLGTGYAVLRDAATLKVLGGCQHSSINNNQLRIAVIETIANTTTLNNLLLFNV